MSAERGSAKLFSIKTHDHDALAEAIGAARGSYEVKWWWWYGQPAFDHIQLGVEVKPAQLGATVTQFMSHNGEGLRVTSEVFPYGIINPGFLVEFNIQRHG